MSLARRTERRAKLRAVRERVEREKLMQKPSAFRHTMAVMVVTGLVLFGLACFIVYVKGWPR